MYFGAKSGALLIDRLAVMDDARAFIGLLCDSVQLRDRRQSLSNLLSILQQWENERGEGLISVPVGKNNRSLS